MKKTLKEEIEELLENDFPAKVKEIFRKKLAAGKLIREEDPENHLCSYFAAYDPNARQVFIGHHKKANLWLFNGGHIDAGESLLETTEREISEEWGLEASNFNIGQPLLLTLTEIDNRPIQNCRLHFDLWHFIKIDRNNFQPNATNLAKEFHRTEWLSIEEARKIVTEKNTLEALNFIGNNLF